MKRSLFLVRRAAGSPRTRPVARRSPASPRSPAPARRAPPRPARRRAPRTVAPVVELYTSEGCNSCPPADRWLSKLKADPAVVALAFHVDYWDRLGWKDRFASAAFTARQAEQQASNGARFSYTPQVVVDGRDRTDWSRASRAGRRRGRRRRSTSRSRARATASSPPSRPRPARRKRLAAYWAVTEQGHVSAVKAGENEGVDAAPRLRRARLRAGAGLGRARGAPQTLAFKPATRGRRGASAQRQPRRRRRRTGRPVQAVKIGC